MLKIINRIGLEETSTSGIDDPELCGDLSHFRVYPKRISYRYNSRGFRDHEWPEDLSDVIWCVGDSFTVGIGQPFDETWPQLLQKKLGRRCINLGEDGCSNDTISLRIRKIYELYNPKLIVVMWSYLARRRVNGENVNHNKDDFGNKEDMENFIKNFKIVNELPISVINTIVPNAYVRTDSLNYLVKKITGNISWDLTAVEQLDYARDYHHFDVKTSEHITNLIIEKIENLDY
jgi:hypothetical protein